MPVSESSATAAQKLYLLAVLSHLTQEVAGFGVKHHCAARYFDYLVLAVLARTAVAGSALSVACKHVTLILQRQECPHVFIAAQDYVASATSVATVGTAFGNELVAVEVTRSGTAFA